MLEVVSGFDLDEQGARTVALLGLIAGQDVEPADGSDGTDGRWRIARKVAKDRVISVVDPEARHAHKTVSRKQDGFKAHLAVEPGRGDLSPHLCEEVELRSMTATRRPAPIHIHPTRADRASSAVS